MTQETDSVGTASTLRMRFAHFIRTARTPFLIAVGYFLLQFTQIGQYGASWDEPLHRNWGKLFIVFWQTGDRAFLDLMPGHGIEYGPLYYALNYLISEWVYGQGLLTFVAASHLLNIATAAAATGLTYVLGRMIGGRKMGVISVIFLVFFPQFLAHSHYNPKDIPLMTAVLATAIAFLRALRIGKTRSFVHAAFWMGAAVAAKVSALIMAPVFLMTYVIWLTLDPRSSALRTFRKQVILLPLCVVVCIAAMVAFWPSAWGDALLIPRAVKFFLSSDFWPGRVVFFGHDYSGAELPWFYTPFELMAATPVLMLIAFAAGIAIVIRRIKMSGTAAEYSLLFLWSIFPFLITLVPGIVRYDGMRQFFFALPPMCVIAAHGADYFLSLLKRKAKRASAMPVFAFLVMFSLVGEVWILHPFEGSYRNEIIRTFYPKDMDRSFQIEYWGSVYLQGIDWLIANAEPDPEICVPTAGVLVDWYPWRPDFTFDCTPETDYIMFFTRYTEAKEYADLPVVPVFTISRMNADLLKIYQIR